MLSYSHAHGVFGVSLTGTSLGPDSGAGKKLYIKKDKRPGHLLRQCAGTRLSRTSAFDAAREIAFECLSQKVLITADGRFITRGLQLAHAA
jgi:hypothetical protein